MCLSEALYKSLRTDGAATLKDMQGRFERVPLHELLTTLDWLVFQKYARYDSGRRLYVAQRLADVVKRETEKLRAGLCPPYKRDLSCIMRMIENLGARVASSSTIGSELKYPMGKTCRLLNVGAVMGVFEVVSKAGSHNEAIWRVSLKGAEFFKQMKNENAL